MPTDGGMTGTVFSVDSDMNSSSIVSDPTHVRSIRQLNGPEFIEEPG